MASRIPLAENKSLAKIVISAHKYIGPTMIHSRIFDWPCPKCKVVGNFGALFITNDELVQGCSACNMKRNLPLPILKKTILYLDQFFLSSAFREKNKPFVEAMERIRDLATRQLIVCPWSNLHEDETHQWRHSQQQDLWAFVKATAGGHRFSHAESIKQQQIVDGFVGFQKGMSGPAPLDEDDAFHGNVHQWDNFVWIDIRSRIDDSDKIRQGKKWAAQEMANLFDQWRARPQSFSNDFNDECSGYVSSILESYQSYLIALNSQSFSSPIEIFGSSNVQIVTTLMIEQDSSLDFSLRYDNVRDFLVSDSFRKIPHIDASCRLMASLRKAIRRGELPTTETATKAMHGFGQDMEMISVFAPYTDAIFIDRAMHRWISDAECNLPKQFGFAAYSVENWNSFLEFLDRIEQGAPENHDFWLRLVYG